MLSTVNNESDVIMGDPRIFSQFFAIFCTDVGFPVQCLKFARATFLCWSFRKAGITVQHWMLDDQKLPKQNYFSAVYA